MAKGKFRFYFFWLSVLCVFVFLLELLDPSFTEFAILNKRALLQKEYWRFLTSIFIHGSLSHLFYNMFALLFFGFSLERLVGSRRFLIIFLSSGIIANLVSVNIYESSAGASGAIYGIIGCLAIIRPFMIVWAFGLIMPMFIAAILWIIGDLMGLFIPSDIGHIAHLSGAAVGILIGLLLRGLNKKKEKDIDKFKEKLVFPEPYMRKWEDEYMQ